MIQLDELSIEKVVYQVPSRVPPQTSIIQCMRHDPCSQHIPRKHLAEALFLRCLSHSLSCGIFSIVHTHNPAKIWQHLQVVNGESKRGNTIQQFPILCGDPKQIRAPASAIWLASLHVLTNVWKRQMSSCLEVIGPRCFQNEFKLTTQCDAILDPLTPSLSHLGEAPFFKVIKPFINQEIPLD